MEECKTAINVPSSSRQSGSMKSHTTEMEHTPHPDKAADIKGMTKPSNQKELQEFLGVITYISPFMSKLSDATKPRGPLKDTEFTWTSSYEAAFQRVKNLICKTTLAYFDLEGNKLEYKWSGRIVKRSRTRPRRQTL